MFLGQKPIGQECFRRLRSTSDVTVAAVVSNIGTDNWWKDNALHGAASEEGIPFVPNDRRHDDRILTLVKDLDIDTLISVQHPWILPGSVLSAVPQAFNLHLAKLPQYQGWNACTHALLNGDVAFSSTVHWMVEDVDSGDIAYETTVAVDPRETASTLYEKAVAAGLAAFNQLLADLSAGRTPPRVPMVGEARYYRRSDIEPFRDATGAPSEELDRRARALYFPPFEPAFIRSGAVKVYLIPATVYGHGITDESRQP